VAINFGLKLRGTVGRLNTLGW